MQTHKAASLTIDDPYILSYMEQHEDLNIIGFIRMALRERENTPKQETIQTVSSNDETVTITKSELRSLYAEFTSFVKIRDDCFEQFKPLKFAKLNRLVSLCETHLDIKRALTKCSYCTFEAKNLKSMAAHLRSCTHKPVLAAVSSIGEQEGSEGEDEEEEET